MDEDLLALMDLCVSSVNRLLAQMKEDRESMPQCLGGEPLLAYLQTTEIAEGKIRELRKKLCELQNRLA